MNFEEVYNLYKNNPKKFDEWYKLDETIEIPLKLKRYSIYLICEALADDKNKDQYYEEDPSALVDYVLYEATDYFL